MIKESTFKPAWWLTNTHLQTMFATLTRKIKTQFDSRERLELPDGDFIDLAWVTKDLPEDAPLIIILHGLGGSIQSSYVAGLSQAFKKAGFRSLLMHFRGASEEPNRLSRAYHSGDTGDFHYLLQCLAEREPHTLKAAVGISLGGNVLLKWLGEQGEQPYLKTAVAVSVPFELRLVAERISSGFSSLYQRYLLRRLKKVFERKKSVLSSLPSYFDEIDKLKCFWTFDDKITAPLHGFSSVHQYYRESSSKPYLKKIKTPTLIIHALDDPFMMKSAAPKAEEISSFVDLELSKKGGHVGFIASQKGRPVFWLEKRIPEYLLSVFEAN